MENKKSALLTKNIIEKSLGGEVNLTLKRKRNQKESLRQEDFVNIISGLEEAKNRSLLLYSTLKLDFSTYDELYHLIIGSFMSYTFSKPVCDLISFYLYERLDIKGNIIPYNMGGDMIIISNSIELYSYVKMIENEA